MYGQSIEDINKLKENPEKYPEIAKCILPDYIDWEEFNKAELKESVESHIDAGFDFYQEQELIKAGLLPGEVLGTLADL